MHSHLPKLLIQGGKVGGGSGSGGDDGTQDSKDPHSDSAAAEKPIIALGDSARRYQCTAILSPPPALPAAPTCLL